MMTEETQSVDEQLGTSAEAPKPAESTASAVVDVETPQASVTEASASPATTEPVAGTSEHESFVERVEHAVEHIIEEVKEAIEGEKA